MNDTNISITLHGLTVSQVNAVTAALAQTYGVTTHAAEPTPAPVEPSPSAPVIATPAAPSTPTKTPKEIVLDMLRDPRYTWRTASSLRKVLGWQGSRLADFLEDWGIDFSTCERRSDGALLIRLNP